MKWIKFNLQIILYNYIHCGFMALVKTLISRMVIILSDLQDAFSFGITSTDMRDNHRVNPE